MGRCQSWPSVTESEKTKDVFYLSNVSKLKKKSIRSDMFYAVKRSVTTPLIEIRLFLYFVHKHTLIISATS